MTTIRATRHTSEGGKAFRIYAAYSGSPEEVQVFKRSFKGARRQEDRLTSAVGGGGGREGEGDNAKHDDDEENEKTRTKSSLRAQRR